MTSHPITFNRFHQIPLTTAGVTSHQHYHQPSHQHHITNPTSPALSITPQHQPSPQHHPLPAVTPTRTNTTQFTLSRDQTSLVCTNRPSPHESRQSRGEERGGTAGTVTAPRPLRVTPGEGTGRGQDQRAVLLPTRRHHASRVQAKYRHHAIRSKCIRNIAAVELQQPHYL